MKNTIYIAVLCLAAIAAVILPAIWWRSRRIKVAVKEPKKRKPFTRFLPPDEFDSYFRKLLDQALEQGSKIRLMRCFGPRIILRIEYARYFADDRELLSELTLTGSRKMRDRAWELIVKDRTNPTYAKLYVGF